MRCDARRARAGSLIAVLALLSAHGAAAQPSAKPRVVVRTFEGPSAARVRDAVVQALRKTKRYEVVPNDRAEEAAGRLDADLTTDAGRAAVGRELALSGFVSGTIEKRGKQFAFELIVHGGSSGTQTDERTFRARKPGPLVGQVRRRFSTQLRRKPLELEQPAKAEPQLQVTEAEPEPEAEAEPQAEPEAESEQKKRKPRDDDEAEREAREAAEAEGGEGGAEAGEDWPALELALGARAMTRSFTYEAPVTQLPEHRVSLTPAGQVQLRFYPAAPFTGGFAAHVGLELYGQLMLPVEAKDGPSVFETSSWAFGGALRARIPLWPSELGVHAGWGAHDVEIADSQFGGDPEVPSVAYRFLRFGADARIVLSERFALSLRASYLLLLGYGELAEERWFPDASGFGLDAQLGAGYALGGPFWAEAGVGMTRYSLTLNVEPAPSGSTVTPRDAEGAVDQQFFGSLAIALRL